MHQVPLLGWFADNWLALYGAGLSTFIFATNLYAARPRMKVEIIAAMDDDGRFGISVGILNPSSHPIHVSSVWLLYRHRKYTWRHLVQDMLRFGRWSRSWGWCHTSQPLIGVETGLPRTIAPHTAHRIFVAESRIEVMLRDATTPEIRAVAQDALGRNQYSCRYDPRPFSTV